MKLHPDWPEYEPAMPTWRYPEPISDLAEALQGGVTLTAEVPSAPAIPIRLPDVRLVTRYSVSYHGEKWTSGDDGGGTELEMVLYGQLTDGRWFSVNAWNDYTGWGCQDESQVRIGPDEASIIAHGLDNEGRTALGITT